MFCGYSSIKGVLEKHMQYTEYAFGISELTCRNIISTFVDRKFTFERKCRSDKGTSIFDSEIVRKELSHHFIPTKDESFANGERQQKKYHTSY